MSARSRVVFLFPGQGAQHPRMAADLYGVDEAFTGTMDAAFSVLDDPALRKIWLRPDPGPLFHDITRAQPLLLAVNCALASTVMAAGIHPDAVLGHSVGEIAAAVVADVLDFTDALALLADFVRHYRHAPAGGMLAVAADPESVRERLTGLPDVVIGAVNGPRQVLVCGGNDGLQAARQRLRADGITCADVHALQPFHSPLMNTVAPDATLGAARGRLSAGLRAPRQPMYSGYLGGLLDPAHATDPEFWLTQPARPVLFGPALRAVLADGPCTFVETGPGQSLSALARRTAPVAAGDSRCIALLPPRRLPPGADRSALAAALDRLGAPITTAASGRKE
ncbi:Beta-ketoacyl-acyl-carrier-protein synthase I [Nocardia otitidiscaviarum]|uniref:Beta-ketoacyl-acyl-carrier-protein synthase I n=1 Tax=Nocardia otitidiscaviarum TaxID=1823 RepID=A0A378YXS8_9NOCA|nr:acyltransferase domain-containing protein [Nocardia otitidiscaviarum]SUA81320.1 Beta-ketoacyl-acyl-carrier-protein synthase I [Nocardia otitidiscaviarum]